MRGQKQFRVQKIVVKKEVWVQNILGPKYFRSKKIWVQKNNWVQIEFHVQKTLWVPKNGVQKKFG